MPDLVLGDLEQKALPLISAEPVPGSPLLGPDVLEALSRLIGCGYVSSCLADNTGLVEASTPYPDVDPQVSTRSLLDHRFRRSGQLPDYRLGGRQNGAGLDQGNRLLDLG